MPATITDEIIDAILQNERRMASRTRHGVPGPEWREPPREDDPGFSGSDSPAAWGRGSA